MNAVSQFFLIVVSFQAASASCSSWNTFGQKNMIKTITKPSIFVIYYFSVLYVTKIYYLVRNFY